MTTEKQLVRYPLLWSSLTCKATIKQAVIKALCFIYRKRPRQIRDHLATTSRWKLTLSSCKDANAIPGRLRAKYPNLTFQLSSANRNSSALFPKQPQLQSKSFPLKRCTLKTISLNKSSQNNQGLWTARYFLRIREVKTAKRRPLTSQLSITSLVRRKPRARRGIILIDWPAFLSSLLAKKVLVLHQQRKTICYYW